jgi:hypothetical protein
MPERKVLSMEKTDANNIHNSNNKLDVQMGVHVCNTHLNCKDSV